MFRSISSFIHAGANTPAESLGAVAISPNGNGLPRYQGGSASATSVSRPARRSLHVPARMFAESPEVTRYTRVLQRIRCLLRRSGCFRPSDRLAGWDLHPLEIADFHGVPDKLDYVRLTFGLQTRPISYGGLHGRRPSHSDGGFRSAYGTVSRGRGATNASVKDFQQPLPNCRITRPSPSRTLSR